MLTSAQAVEMSVTVTLNSPSQDYTHPEDHNLPNYDMTSGFKPFTVFVFFTLVAVLIKVLSPAGIASLTRNSEVRCKGTVIPW